MLFNTNFHNLLFIAAYIYFCSSSIYQFVLCPIDGRNLYSAGYILEVAGIPYSTTQSIEEALDGSGMILFSSPVKKTRLRQKSWSNSLNG